MLAQVPLLSLGRGFSGEILGRFRKHGGNSFFLQIRLIAWNFHGFSTDHLPKSFLPVLFFEVALTNNAISSELLTDTFDLSSPYFPSCCVHRCSEKRGLHQARSVPAFAPRHIARSRFRRHDGVLPSLLYTSGLQAVEKRQIARGKTDKPTVRGHRSKRRQRSGRVAGKAAVAHQPHCSAPSGFVIFHRASRAPATRRACGARHTSFLQPP